MRKKKNNNCLYFFAGVLLVLLIVIGIFLFMKNNDNKEVKKDKNEPVIIEEINNWLDYLLSQEVDSIILNKTNGSSEIKYELTKSEFKNMFENDGKTKIKRGYPCDLGSVNISSPSVTVIYTNSEGKKYEFNNQDWISVIEYDERPNKTKTHYIQDRLFLEAIDKNIEDPEGTNTCNARELVYYAGQKFVKSTEYDNLGK